MHKEGSRVVRTVLSDNKIDYWDKTIPVIQGNILCCEKEEGKEAVFYNMFESYSLVKM